MPSHTRNDLYRKLKQGLLGAMLVAAAGVLAHTVERTMTEAGMGRPAGWSAQDEKVYRATVQMLKEMQQAQEARSEAAETGGDSGP
ncbi:MAG: hypothetical protein AAGJ10_08275 [Bacteroidota bacterium]